MCYHRIAHGVDGDLSGFGKEALYPNFCLEWLGVMAVVFEAASTIMYARSALAVRQGQRLRAYRSMQLMNKTSCLLN